MASQIDPADRQFKEFAVEKVEGDREHGWWISYDGLCLGVPGDSPVEPCVGMVARLYGPGLGSRVRGLILDGAIVWYRTVAEEEALRAEESRRHEEENARRQAEPRLPVPQIPGFEWTEDMAQISGFGGGYERACRAMVSAGCKWWSEHPDADPQFRGFKRVYGLITEDNADAKALSKIVTDAAGGDCTGAMHQASVSHVFAWRELGSWIAYQKKMREIAIERLAEGDTP